MNRKQTNRLAIDSNVRAGGFKAVLFSGTTSSSSSLGALEGACSNLGGSFSASGSSSSGWDYSCTK